LQSDLGKHDINARTTKSLKAIDPGISYLTRIAIEG